MPLATKNGSLIVTDGQIAENCDCCGGWYCYKCEDGFAVDCKSFGQVAINGNSSFEPRLSLSATIAGVGGCFEVQGGTLFQRSSSTMCELWSISPGFNDCSKQYQRWSILPAGTDPRFMTSGVEVPMSFYFPGGAIPIESRIQSRLTIQVDYSASKVCGDVGTQYRIVIGCLWELYYVIPSSSSSLWAASLLVSESYGETQYVTPAGLSPDGAVTFSTGSLFASAPTSVSGGNLVPARPIVSPRPPSMDVVITPTVFKAGCNNQ